MAKKEQKEHPSCPYCDAEVSKAELPFCKACKVEVFYCPECRKPVSRDKKTCPSCGAKIHG